MQHGRNWFRSALIVWLATFACPPFARAETRVGVAETEITPPHGFPMAGYYFERLAAGTHDPLKAKAIALIGDADQAAIVVCDLTGVGADLTAEVRRRAVLRRREFRPRTSSSVPRIRTPHPITAGTSTNISDRKPLRTGPAIRRP